MAKLHTIEITGAQAHAGLAALDSYLQAGDWSEQLAIFGSPAGVRAAHNVRDKLTPAAVHHYERTGGR